ncbi:MAG TPA: Crp/Fnr family transcriptional regulator [Chthoniobacterales bacterium]|nr:Crp/Fnr family transcriptional regulator [Chthoniobacterales bacterium]
MHHPLSEFRTLLEEKLTGWNLPAELAAEIEERSTTVGFEKGAIVFLHGAPMDLIFWLRSGFVKLYLPHADGNRTLIAVARPGEPLGMVANVDADGRNHQIFEAQALTKCSLSIFSREQMTSLLRKLDHERLIQLLGHLNATWSALLERCAGFIGVPFRERLETVFKELGTRFGVDDKRGTLIILELGHEALAEMIGSSRPMVSKLLVDMVEEGLLARTEQRQFILLRQDERQSKLDSSLEVRPSGKAVRASKSPARMAVRSSIPASGDRSRVALSAMNHSFGRHNA